MEVVHKKDKHLIEFGEGEDKARLVYKFYKNSLAVLSTYVPKSERGKGIAAALTKAVFTYAKEINKSVMMYCSYTSLYVNRHPELRKQLNTSFHS